MDRRVVVSIVVLLAIVLGSVVLMGCTPKGTRPNCVAEEVEMEMKNGIKSFEMDFTDGREIAITEVQYNFYRGQKNFSYPCPIG